MRLKYNLKEELLTVHQYGHLTEIEATCDARNELNGDRPLHDPDDRGKVILAMNTDPHTSPPVMPRQFPNGTWNVGKPVQRSNPYNKYLAPFYIPTDAEQLLDIWKLDEDGGYDHPIGRKIIDMYYGLHFSTSSTTVGCIRIHKENDLLWLVEHINGSFVSKDEIIISVMAA